MQRQELNAIGEKLFKDFCITQLNPASALDVFKFIKSELIRETLGDQAFLADKICSELRRKFSTGEALIIVTAAERAARKEENSTLTRQANWRKRAKIVGNCPQCGDPCDINPKTGKPYHNCAKCRVKIAPKQAALMQKRRATGTKGSAS